MEFRVSLRKRLEISIALFAFAAFHGLMGKLSEQVGWWLVAGVLFIIGLIVAIRGAMIAGKVQIVIDKTGIATNSQSAKWSEIYGVWKGFMGKRLCIYVETHERRAHRSAFLLAMGTYITEFSLTFSTLEPGLHDAMAYIKANHPEKLIN